MYPLSYFLFSVIQIILSDIPAHYPKQTCKSTKFVTQYPSSAGCSCRLTNSGSSDNLFLYISTIIEQDAPRMMSPHYRGAGFFFCHSSAGNCSRQTRVISLFNSPGRPNVICSITLFPVLFHKIHYLQYYFQIKAFVMISGYD